MKIIFSPEFKRKISIIAIFFASIYQLSIIFTIIDIFESSFNERNTILLFFNICYIISLYAYNEKIDKILNLRGQYFSKNREKMNKEQLNEENAKICKQLFEEILDGDFRP